MISRASPKGQPGSSLCRQVLGDEATINVISTNTVATFERSCGVPARVRMPHADGLLEVKAFPGEHGMKRSLGHVLIGVKKDH